MSILDWTVIVAYFIGLAIMVVLTRRAKTMEDYAVGSRQIPGSIIFATLSASFLGPGYVMGLANKAADKGYIWFCIFLAFSLQTILVGIFVAPKLRHFDKAYSLGSVMGYRYGKAVQLLSGILSVVLCAGVVGAISKASGDIISGFTGLPFIWAVIISIIVVLLYSTIGGIKTVIMTDVLQFILLSVCVPLILIIMLARHGITDTMSLIPDTTKTLTGHFPPITLFSLFLSFFLGEALLPPYASRALMAKRKSDAKMGFLLSGCFSIAWFFVCASIGILALGILPPGTENYYLGAMQTYLPIGVLGLAVAAMISIIMSSQDSFLNAASIAFSSDIAGVFSLKFVQGKKALGYSRMLNILIGIIAVAFATKVPSIIDALLYCYTLWAPTIVLPLVIALLRKQVQPYAAFSAIILGGVATGVWEWGLNNPYDIPSLLVGVLANQVAFWSVSSLVKDIPKKGWFAPLENKYWEDK
ncbi:sodium:solute symporter family protein [Candidatus Latescibacterota bacterium]